MWSRASPDDVVDERVGVGKALDCLLEARGLLELWKRHVPPVVLVVERGSGGARGALRVTVGLRDALAAAAAPQPLRHQSDQPERAERGEEATAIPPSAVSHSIGLR